MDKLTRLLFLTLFSIYSNTVFADSVQILEGQADANAYTTTLAKQGQWVQRAFNICVDRELCRSPLQLQFRVNPEGKVSQCNIIKSDITHADTANLFCLVVKKAEFPPSTTDVVAILSLDFTTYFAKGRQSCPAELGARAADNSYVQRCLNQILLILNSQMLSEQHKYGADISAISGDMRLQLEISKSGKVYKTKILDSSIASRDFRQMIVAAIERIDFGAANEKESKEIRFNVPFKGVEVL